MFELRIAIRHLTSRRRQTTLSVLAIALAVAVLMVTVTMLAGLTQVFYSETVDKLPHVTVEPVENEKDIQLYQSLATDIRSMAGVTGVSPVLSGQSFFRYKEKARKVVLQGVTVSDLDAVMHLSRNIVKGSLRDLGTTRSGVVIGDDLAGKLKASVGDTVDVSYPDSNPVTLKVVGIYDTGTSLDETLAYTQLPTAQDFFGKHGAVNMILVRLDNPDNAKRIADAIDMTGHPASSWEEKNPEILQTIKLESLMHLIIYGMLVVIASFGIISTMVMVVMGKKKEIGMLMAMGATRKSIMTIFLLESGLLGLTGAVLGVTAGILIAISFGSVTIEGGESMFMGISNYPFVVRAADVGIVILFTFLLNLFAGIYPAHRASGLDPVEAIGSE